MIMMKISKLIIVQKRLLYALPCVLALLAVWGVASVVSQMVKKAMALPFPTLA